MSKKYFEVEVDEALLAELLAVFNVPLMEKTKEQHLLKNTLLTQVGLVVMAQYADLNGVEDAD